MCGIVASISNHSIDLTFALEANSIRGRDSWGFWTPGYSYRVPRQFKAKEAPYLRVPSGTAALANLRAEPTTEWVKEKHTQDIQPYVVGDWAIVHNGTIANDKELLQLLNITSPPTKIDSWVIAALLDHFNDFDRVISMLIGSYAICAVNRKRPDEIHFAMNYCPLYLHRHSILTSVQLHEDDRLLPPYSIGTLCTAGLQFRPLLLKPTHDKALVVCSGGLDSTVAAAALKHQGMEIELLHYDYGCRATMQESVAIHAIAEALDVPLHIVRTPIFTDIIKGSPLTGGNMPVAESEAGAEYAHEWVPARNLIATGIAESRGFNVLALGANLEEAGAYPDNNPEFLKRFSKVLPFATRDGTQLRIETPVGNLMKREIVKLGLEIGAPMELTWSCYNSNDQHCGKCGPCHMRKLAFEMNGSIDPVFNKGK